ncbi:MAG: hypothetical protein HXS54_10990 [Theionarchaea archaeon]|nr:hypothetical protein [Theionarchaea archaeon]
MRCSACGCENPEGSQFCNGCGSKLGVRVKGMDAFTIPVFLPNLSAPAAADLSVDHV